MEQAGSALASAALAGPPPLPPLAALRALKPVKALAGVDVWHLELDLLRGRLDELLPELPVAERERCLQYRQPGDRLRYALCRVVLRQLLAERLHRAAQDIRIDTGPWGKPRLAQDEGLHFNLSHSGRCALIALSTAGSVGVDIERVPVAPGVAELLASLTPGERHYCALNARAQAFFRVWCGKEAVLKALGVGIAQHLCSVSVIPTVRQRYVIDLQLAAAPVRAWQLPVPAGYVGALALQDTAA